MSSKVKGQYHPVTLDDMNNMWLIRFYQEEGKVT